MIVGELFKMLKRDKVFEVGEFVEGVGGEGFAGR